MSRLRAIAVVLDAFTEILTERVLEVAHRTGQNQLRKTVPAHRGISGEKCCKVILRHEAMVAEEFLCCAFVILQRRGCRSSSEYLVRARQRDASLCELPHHLLQRGLERILNADITAIILIAPGHLVQSHSLQEGKILLHALRDVRAGKAEEGIRQNGLEVTPSVQERRGIDALLEYFAHISVYVNVQFGESLVIRLHLLCGVVHDVKNLLYFAAFKGGADGVYDAVCAGDNAESRVNPLKRCLADNWPARPGRIAYSHGKAFS